MSAWKREALKTLPECRAVIERAANPMALWIELHGACEDAYADHNEDLIRRFYGYARWSWQAGGDVQSAVACAFYEHLPLSPITREDMPRRFGRHAFLELREAFCFHLPPSERLRFQQEFLDAEEKYTRNLI
jgi:hypothetical protein